MHKNSSTIYIQPIFPHKNQNIHVSFVEKEMRNALKTGKSFLTLNNVPPPCQIFYWFILTGGAMKLIFNNFSSNFMPEMWDENLW